MCGIAGFVNASFDPSVHPAVIGDMLARIRHRGPDEAGYYTDNFIALGNVRLSIIDLKTGQQPFHDATQRYWLVYNGEIYNYKELREELIAAGRRFITTSDTEVLMEAYVRWGTEAFKRLNGGYAFALYDRLEKKLTLVRDRFGKRPLYYAQQGNAFIFASELKAFLAFPSFEFRWDEDQLSDFCQKFAAKLMRTEPGAVSPRENQAFILLISTGLLDSFFVRKQARLDSSCAHMSFCRAYDGRSTQVISSHATAASAV